MADALSAGAGHAHGTNASPNYVDPAGGWIDTGDTLRTGCQSDSVETNRRRWTKTVSAGQYQLYHTTHLGLGYVYLLEQSQGLGYHELESGLRPTLTATDMHAGSDCGPRVIEYPESCTQLNCDRDAYLFGDGSSQFLSSLRHGWLIQDVHDPNDVTWGHNEFAQVQLHGPATIYCLLPTLGTAGGVTEATCQNAYCEGHSHTLQEVQQALPMWAAQNWQPTGQTITESNGVVCEIYKIQASQPTTLYHTTHLGWSLVYVVDYEPPAAQQYSQSTQGISLFGHTVPGGASSQMSGLQQSSLTRTGGAVTVAEMAGVVHDCPVQAVQNPTTMSEIHCDRSYTFGRGWTEFFASHHNLWLIQDSHDPNDHSWGTTRSANCNADGSSLASWTDATQTGLEQAQSCQETLTEFTRVSLPSPATLHCFVPVAVGGGGQVDETAGHAHSETDYPNYIE